MAITALVKTGETFTGLSGIARHGIGSSQETVGLGTAEVNIAVAVRRLVAP